MSPLQTPTPTLILEDRAAPRSSRIRYTLAASAKVTIATVIVVYLWRTQRLGFARLWTVLEHPGNVIVLLAAMLLLVLILAARWRLLLSSQGYECSFRQVLALTFVAIFFDSLLPGGTSDIVRGYLFDRMFQPHERVRAATTVLVDRFVGIMALLLLAVAALSLQGHPNEHEPWPALRATVSIVGVIFLLGFLYLCGTVGGGRGRLARSLARWRYGATCLELLDTLRSYRHRQGALVEATVLSLIGHLLVIGCFWLLGAWLGETQLGLFDYLFLVPVGLVVAQIPISPGGIGVGHVGFYSLFVLAGSRLGADVFSLYIVLHFVSSLPGLVCFFALKRRPPIAAEQRATAAGT